MKRRGRITNAELKDSIERLILEVRELISRQEAREAERAAIGIDRDRWRAQAEGCYQALLLQRKRSAELEAGCKGKGKGKP